MKTLRRIMMAFFAMVLLGAATSCTKDDDNNGNNGNGGNDEYSAMLVGTWEIDHVTYNGQDATQMMGGIQLTFNANGTGMMDDHGETHNNGFSWVISGSNITVTTNNGYQMVFTIVNMSQNECTFTGTNMEMDGQVLQGNIEIHIVKVNNPGPNPRK